MGIWSKLFGSDNVIQAGIDGIDAMVYTDEEKGRHKIALLNAYAPFKLAQRLLAVTFCIPYAVAWFVTFIASFFIGVTKQLEMLLSPVGLSSIVLAIVVFYFGGGAMSSRKKS